MSRRSSRSPPAPPPAWLSNPPVGTLFRVTEGDREGDVLVRLTGFREDTGSLRFRLVPTSSPRDHLAEYPSVSFLQSKCHVIQMNDLRRAMARVVVQVLQDPPLDGRIVRSRDRLALIPPPVGSDQIFHGLPLFSLPTSSRSLHEILHYNPALPMALSPSRPLVLACTSRPLHLSPHTIIFIITVGDHAPAHTRNKHTVQVL